MISRWEILWSGRTRRWGYEACIQSEKGNYRRRELGAGCGATIGKFAGMDFCMKSGIGSYALQIGELQVGAVVAVNALGDIYDWENRRKAGGTARGR